MNYIGMTTKGPEAVRQKHTDFTGKLLDVWPDGFAQRLTDSLVRTRFRNGGDKQELLTPDQIYSYQIDPWNTCELFHKGHSVRVEVSSSAFPKYGRNQNTGEALAKTSNMMIAKQTIYHDREHPSFVVIPIVPEKSMDLTATGSAR